MNYATPVSEHRSFPVDVVVAPGAAAKGRLQLTPCPYDVTCRQAVIDSDGRLNVYTLNDSFAQITFKVGFMNFDGLQIIADFRLRGNGTQLLLLLVSPRCPRNAGRTITSGRLLHVLKRMAFAYRRLILLQLILQRWCIRTWH